MRRFRGECFNTLGPTGSGTPRQFQLVARILFLMREAMPVSFYLRLFRLARSRSIADVT